MNQPERLERPERHDNSAGSFALNREDQTVAAEDFVRVVKGGVHRYFCVCTCGGVVNLHRGDQRAAHFAYPAGKRKGCTGLSPNPETKEHYDAKWMIHDHLSEFTFWDVCGVNHRIACKEYKASEWVATVEKKIPGMQTLRIADVLLEHVSNGEVVAIEVFKTHQVDFKKTEDCKNANVRIIEVTAADVNSGLRVLNNQKKCDNWIDCSQCVKADKLKKQLDRLHAENRQRDETTHQEVARPQKRERMSPKVTSPKMDQSKRLGDTWSREGAFWCKNTGTWEIRRQGRSSLPVSEHWFHNRITGVLEMYGDILQPPVKTEQVVFYKK